MRIEVLVDVKTILGEGPLWDVEEQRLYWIDSFGMNVFRCTRTAGDPRLGRAAEDRLHGVTKEGRRGGVAGARLPFSRLQNRQR